MRLATFASILLMSLCLSISAQPFRSMDRSIDQSKILAEIEAISKGYVGRDPHPFESIYLENYVSIREKPLYNSRDQLIAMMRADSIFLAAGKKLDYETLLYETEDPQIRFYGRAAIVTSSKRNYWQYRGQKCLTKMISTELWVRPENHWKLAAGHTTTFQCDPKPFHPIHHAVSAVPVRSKPPNTDLEAEQAIRELLNALGKAQKAGGETNRAAMGSVLAPDFGAIDEAGNSTSEYSSVCNIPVTSTRSVGIRNMDDALVIYPDAAVYTFRSKVSAPASQPGFPKQCSLFLVKSEERWLIVSAHTSKDNID